MLALVLWHVFDTCHIRYYVGTTGSCIVTIVAKRMPICYYTHPQK